MTEGDVLLQNARNSYVRSQNRLVAAIGVDNLVVVETADAVMVGATEHMQDIKKVVERLSDADRSEATVHQRVYRPWGSYESLVVGEQFQVKRLTVTPGQTLSLQLHHHRAEHWVVVSGQADIIRGDEQLTLGPTNRRIYRWHKASACEPGRDATRSDRSAVWLVSRRG